MKKYAKYLHMNHINYRPSNQIVIYKIEEG